MSAIGPQHSFRPSSARSSSCGTKACIGVDLAMSDPNAHLVCLTDWLGNRALRNFLLRFSEPHWVDVARSLCLLGVLCLQHLAPGQLAAGLCSSGDLAELVEHIQREERWPDDWDAAGRRPRIVFAKPSTEWRKEDTANSARETMATVLSAGNSVGSRQRPRSAGQSSRHCSSEDPAGVCSNVGRWAGHNWDERHADSLSSRGEARPSSNYDGVDMDCLDARPTGSSQGQALPCKQLQRRQRRQRQQMANEPHQLSAEKLGAQSRLRSPLAKPAERFAPHPVPAWSSSCYAPPPPPPPRRETQFDTEPQHSSQPFGLSQTSLFPTVDSRSGIAHRAQGLGNKSEPTRVLRPASPQSLLSNCQGSVQSADGRIQLGAGASHASQPCDPIHQSCSLLEPLPGMPWWGASPGAHINACSAFASNDLLDAAEADIGLSREALRLDATGQRHHAIFDDSTGRRGAEETQTTRNTDGLSNLRSRAPNDGRYAAPAACSAFKISRLAPGGWAADVPLRDSVDSQQSHPLSQVPSFPTGTVTDSFRGEHGLDSGSSVSSHVSPLGAPWTRTVPF